MHVPIPFQLWIKEFVVFGLLVIAYYLNSTILIPNFLLKNHTGVYLLIVTGIIALIVVSNSYLDFWLNIHQLVEAAFQKLGPPRHRGGVHHVWNIAIIAAMIGTTALVIGVSTQYHHHTKKWQNDKQLCTRKMEQARDKL